METFGTPVAAKVTAAESTPRRPGLRKPDRLGTKCSGAAGLCAHMLWTRRRDHRESGREDAQGAAPDGTNDDVAT